MHSTIVLNNLFEIKLSQLFFFLFSVVSVCFLSVSIFLPDLGDDFCDQDSDDEDSECVDYDLTGIPMEKTDTRPTVCDREDQPRFGYLHSLPLCTLSILSSCFFIVMIYTCAYVRVR